MKIHPPQMPAMLYEADKALTDEVTLEACRMKAVDLSDRVARAVSLDQVCLEKVNLSAAKLEHLNGRDIILKDSNLTAGQFQSLSLQRMQASGCRCSGLDASQGTLKDIVFDNCKFEVTNFRFCKIERVKFSNCQMKEADFLGAELHNVIFQDCDLTGVNFNQASLKSVDLRSSTLAGLSGWQHLKGATIDSEQLILVAPFLALELGIRVDE